MIGHIRTVPWEYGDIKCDYQVGATAGVLYLSCVLAVQLLVLLSADLDEYLAASVTTSYTRNTSTRASRTSARITTSASSCANATPTTTRLR